MEILSIVLHSIPSAVVELDEDISPIDALFAGSTPRLREVVLRGAFVPLSSPMFSGLTRLDPFLLLHAIEPCPPLQVLALTDIYVASDFCLDPAPLSLKLPCLQILRMRQVILSSILTAEWDKKELAQTAAQTSHTWVTCFHSLSPSLSLSVTAATAAFSPPSSPPSCLPSAPHDVFHQALGLAVTGSATTTRLAGLAIRHHLIPLGLLLRQAAPNDRKMRACYEGLHEAHEQTDGQTMTTTTCARAFLTQHSAK
ncbi:hypothetical protein BOTBODRAFT_180797 [Botryobasidium botryosum FD-172 SS1]|uniref:Uncharacterized protein n=1 Tax=Botryobasidium botryosum (strain FD-172 SS1) TaxID=930990 RepID=A0A067LVL9_BOTB1|nr:hypothetical protein BOTBODRAFT_180797 [Botryobasidium botryosum FD-172 SS1]